MLKQNKIINLAITSKKYLMKIIAKVVLNLWNFNVIYFNKRTLLNSLYLIKVKYVIKTIFIIND